MKPTGKLLSIYKFGLSVCLFVSNKRQNGWTDRAQIFCGHHVTTGKVYEWSKFQIFVSIKIFCENPRIIYVLFYDVHKENMFTINLQDVREAPSKASNTKSGGICIKC